MKTLSGTNSNCLSLDPGHTYGRVPMLSKNFPEFTAAELTAHAWSRSTDPCSFLGHYQAQND